MQEREPSFFTTRFKENFKPLGKRVAFPGASVLLALAAACSDGESEPTPTLTEVPTFTPRPTATETFTSTPTETLTLTPEPPSTSLPPCNSGRFINPVDGQVVPGHFDVRVNLAHNQDWKGFCRLPLTEDLDETPIRAVLIDRYGNKFRWDIFYCPGLCERKDVIIADFSGRTWQIELAVGDQIVDQIHVITE